MEKWTAKKLYFDSVIPFSKILEEMEYHGFRIDKKKMAEVDDEFTERIEKCSKNIYKIAGKTFNIRSTPQLSTVLYKDLKIPNYVEDYMPDKNGKWVLVKDEFLTDKQSEDRKKGLEVVGTSTDVFAIKKIQQVYDHPIVNELLEFKKLAKLKSTYIDGLKDLIFPDGKVHPSFFQLSFGARPICVAKGTFIETVRDVSKFPKGIPIEDVKVGDYVYCLDDNLKPDIKRVLWSGKTGTKKVVRLYWNATGNSRKGHLDLTPEHLVRLVDGSYVEAKNLVGDHRKGSMYAQKISVLSLCRTGHFLSFTNNPQKGGKGILDHRLVYQKLVGDITSEDCVHHIDGNHLNNTPSNLVKLSTPDHARIHFTPYAQKEETRKRSAENFLKAWRDGKIKVRRGEEHSSYLGLSKFTCLKLIAKAKGRIHYINHDFQTFVNYLKKYNIDHKHVRLRYGKDGQYISKSFLKKDIESGILYEAIMEKYKADFRKIRYLMNYYGLKRQRKWANQFGSFNAHNHYITNIEYLEEEVDVYDLIVEDNHNFFANEICVHNCDSPNLLQIPSRTDDGKKIKELFIVDSDEYDLVSMDFSAMELRFLAWLANDRVMFKAFMDNIDVHSLMCSNIKQFGLTYEQACEKKNKNKRFCAKTTNFLIVYGGGFSELQNQLLKQGDLYIPKKECAEFMGTFYKTFPDIRPLQERVFDFVDRKGYISNIFGRKRYFKNLLDKPNFNNKEEVKAYDSMKSSAHRSAFSHFISSSSSGDYSAYKSALLKQMIVKHKFDAHFVNMLYDAIYIQVHKSQTEEFVPMMQELMSRADSPVEIRLPVEIGIGKNWGEV